MANFPQHACVLLQSIKVYKRTTFLLHCAVWIQSGADPDSVDSAEGVS